MQANSSNLVGWMAALSTIVLCHSVDEAANDHHSPLDALLNWQSPSYPRLP